jgi:hypothetical protein
MPKKEGLQYQTLFKSDVEVGGSLRLAEVKERRLGGVGVLLVVVSHVEMRIYWRGAWCTRMDYGCVQTHALRIS